MNDELIMVVPYRAVLDFGAFHGFVRNNDGREQKFKKLLEQVEFQPRDAMEVNANFKQLIPYVLFHREREEQWEVFRYNRSKEQAESRLHGLWSVGIGGHVHPQDQTLEAAMLREVAEEVVLSLPLRFLSNKPFGFVNDDTNAVGRVHLGVVYLFDITYEQLEPRESGLAQAGFVPVQQLIDEKDQYESWSKLCIEGIYVPPLDVDMSDDEHRREHPGQAGSRAG